MRKIPSQNIDKDLCYKWEFVRRNPDYRTACDNYIKCGKPISLKKEIIKRFSYFPDDYRKNYDELLERRSAREQKRRDTKKDIRRLAQDFAISGLDDTDWPAIADSYSIERLTLKNRKDLTFKPIPDKGHVNNLKKIKTLRVSLNLYYSKEKIFKQLGDIIDHYRAYIKVAHGAKLDPAERFRIYYDSVTRNLDLKKISNESNFLDISSRARFGEYKRYLKVYDLVIKGKTLKEIAKRLYSGDIERDMNYAIRKVRRDYDRCKRLIDGGYRQIR